MFDKLLDFILHWMTELSPLVVINQYQKGLRLRLGKSRGVIDAGLHWKIPFADNIIIEMVATTTIPLPEQTITTKDNQSIVVRSVIKYEVSDVERFLIDVYDAKDAMSDMTRGIIRDIFISKNWSECNDPEIVKTITSKARTEAEKWGLKINKVTLTDLGLMRSIRLIGNLSGKDNDSII
jgi:regulator of protease activity HflC (stomatin/prohibitin superfamily)